MKIFSMVYIGGIFTSAEQTATYYIKAGAGKLVLAHKFASMVWDRNFSMLRLRETTFVLDKLLEEVGLNSL